MPGGRLNTGLKDRFSPLLPVIWHTGYPIDLNHDGDILTRIVGSVFVLLILSVMTFTLMHGVPGGPWAYGQRLMSDEQLARFRPAMGWTSLVVKYLIWLSGVVRGDFGRPSPTRMKRCWGLLAAPGR